MNRSVAGSELIGHAHLNPWMAHADWRPEDLWLATVGLGGDLDVRSVAEVVAGTKAPTRTELGVLTVALGERLHELERDVSGR